MAVSDKELESTVQVDPISEGRDSLAKIITHKVDAQCKTYGISVTDLLIKRIVYVDAVKASE
jgi:regulator of protease activity HflC (stomatin/prohibitin superfamily)